MTSFTTNDHRDTAPLGGAAEERTSPQVIKVLRHFENWLGHYGQSSWDHQSYFAGSVGRRAKALYYRNRLLGIVGVAPMIFSEAFIPSARRLFGSPMRFPIADAHYAMGFGYLFRNGGDSGHFEKMVALLEALKRSRSPGLENYCWGYPFDWVTQGGVLKKGTPFITSTPYVFEAFHDAYKLEPREEWKEVLESIAKHAARDIAEFATSDRASSCAYYPGDEAGGVVNAAAYRAWVLTSASEILSSSDYREVAERNVQFVLDSQNEDGSWYYAVDGVRNFVDHYHTCFVMKALAKIHNQTGHDGCLLALERGVDYYLKNLFAEDGLPQPFAKAPRLTVYTRELYDCAECINLCLLLKDRFSTLEVPLRNTVRGILGDWLKPDGSFRGRRLLFGWDNTPMHRWGQSQMFRALALLLQQECD